MRGVSLEEISESTKIGTRSLRALEEEDFEKLPGGIFNKGFVRAYSRFLGLDEDEAVADFDAAWKQHQAATGPLPEVQPDSQPDLQRGPSNRLMAMAVIVLLVIAVGGYAVKHFLSKRTEDVTQESRHELQQVASPESGAESQTQTIASNPISESAPPIPKSESSPLETHKVAAEAAPKIPIASAKASSTDLASTTSSAAILLEVIAHEDSWLSVSADGKSLGQGILSAQKSRTIRANKEVHLRVGNVAGVEVSFNGRPVNIDGEPKQVKELTFTPDGLQQ